MRSVQADAHGAMQSCVSALRGTARQHLVPKALDGLERLGERHAGPLAAHDKFLYPDRLIPCDLGHALCRGAPAPGTSSR